MNIQELNERIEQLTNLVISADETIKNAKEMITLAEQERDRLADQRRESEPEFERVKDREYYHSVGCHFCNEGEMVACRHYENHDRGDDKYFANNNYFRTEKRAKEVASKINLLLKLERLHDTFCPDYVPDWGNRWLSKYYIYQDKSMGNIWIWGEVNTDSDAVQVYFPTEEIAQKVCNVLNAELKEENEGNCNE